MSFPINEVRRRFPALSQPAVFFDGPAGSQTPRTVIQAMGDYLARMNANHGGLFATSVASDAMLAEAHRAAADLVGTDDPDTIVFGANMTTLTFALSRALARTWRSGDEIVVTELDHDANVTPWVLAARDVGATVKTLRIRHADCTLDLDELQTLLSPRTRLVAVGCASNAVGTINPVAAIARMAHAVGALVFLDAVHLAPHLSLDVREWDCDFLACSAYKFFGPHVGILWGRRALLEGQEAYKVRPASNGLPGKWMTGTQNHEGIAGVMAAIDYLAGLGNSFRPAPNRRAALGQAYAAIQAYEQGLSRQFLARLADVPHVRLWGIAEPERINERVATFALTHHVKTAGELATHLAERGIYAWHGNYYALALTEALGLEPHGMLRIGLLHYNTAAEVGRLFDELKRL